MRDLRLLAALGLTLVSATATPSSLGKTSPQTIVDELLAVDRAFSAAAQKTNVVDAIGNMLSSDAVLPMPTGTFARGKAQAIEALSTNPDYMKGRIEWFPARAGISADGLHGFTVGYMTLQRPDGTRVPMKYLSYWVKQPDGWRVAVHKRGRSAEGAVPREPMAPALPLALVAPAGDAALTDRHRTSLAQAEQAFSDEAQKIGIGPAFAKYGSADAVNMGGPATATFILGADAIGRSVGAGGPANESPVTWAADYAVLVASSGDLGATMGFIRPKKAPPAGQPAAVPFVTVWRRASASDPWRYVAE